MVSDTVVKEQGLETYPTEPVMVTLPIGKVVESRQIALFMFDGVKKRCRAILT
jgi:hypothetical protein